MTTTNPAYSVYPIDSEATFKNVLKDALSLDPRIVEPIEKKKQFIYLTNYLYNEKRGLKVKTIVVEYHYSSIPFLTDYINYYANCYHDYSRICRRIHFFSNSFETEEFTNMIIAGDNEDNWESYAGNIVVKPIPSGFIGPTLLQTYSEREGRFYKAIKDYTVNVFGCQLVLKTLQYQEQDGIVGSCASAAMDFAFQKTSELFGSKTPSPSEITLLAGDDSDYSGKNFPNTELSIPQIGRAITSTGLIAENITDESYLNDDRWFNACVYSYLRSGIPLLLGINIDTYRLYHLVALNGYRFGTHTITRDSNAILNFDLVSDDIIKFYAHDDQLGPFTRLDIIQERDREKKFLTAYWDEGYLNRLIANPVSLIIPLQKSIKVSFHNIAEEVTVLHTVMNQLLTDEEGNPLFEFVWDIYLIKSNEYKKEIRTDLIKHKKIEADGADVLFKSLPQYVWVARLSALDDGRSFLMFDLIYDPIDVNYKRNPYYAQIFNKSFLKVLIDSGVIYELAVFKDYYEDGPEDIDLFSILSDDSSVIDFLEQKEDLIKSELNKPNLGIEEYLKELEKLYGDDFRKIISNQKDQLAGLETSEEQAPTDETDKPLDE